MTTEMSQSSLPSQSGKETVPVAVEGVTVRYMTPADAGFVAKNIAYGFRAKMDCLVGKEKTEDVVVALTHQNTLFTREGHRRVLIAEYNGRLAGVATLRFRNQEPDPSDSRALFRRLGFWTTLRMAGMMIVEAKFGKVLERHCLLNTLTVEDGFRGRGIGKALLTACDQRAREEHCHTIYLYCAVGNRAKNLYDRYGYKELVIKDIGYFANRLIGVRRFHQMAKPL